MLKKKLNYLFGKPPFKSITIWEDFWLSYITYRRKWSIVFARKKEIPGNLRRLPGIITLFSYELI